MPARLFAQDRLLVGLLRCWSSGRAGGGNPLPAMLQMARGSNDCTLVPACDSYFALTEACLARPLSIAAPGHFHDPAYQHLTSDEQAVLTALRHCPPPGDAARTSPAIPHGLPGALCWAAYAVRRALGLAQSPSIEMAHCPFGADAPYRPVMPSRFA